MVRITITASETVHAMMTGSSKLSLVDPSHPRGRVVGFEDPDEDEWSAGAAVGEAADVAVVTVADEVGMSSSCASAICVSQQVAWAGRERKEDEV